MTFKWFDQFYCCIEPDDNNSEEKKQSHIKIRINSSHFHISNKSNYLKWENKARSYHLIDIKADCSSKHFMGVGV